MASKYLERKNASTGANTGKLVPIKDKVDKSKLVPIKDKVDKNKLVPIKNVPKKTTKTSTNRSLTKRKIY